MAYPFRIERPAPIRAESLANNTQDSETIQVYMDRLIKLIPAEIIGLYLTVRGFWIGRTSAVSASLPSNPVPASRPGFLDWWPIVCVLLLLLTRLWGTRAPNGSWTTIQISPVIIATVSFVIWVYAIGDAIFGWKPEPPYASTAVVVWVFLVPVFYKGSE